MLFARSHSYARNPGAKTIEAELFKALCAEGLVSEDNAVDPKKVSWMRACRTDKGVHAAGQVVSLKMLLKDDIAEKDDKAEKDELDTTDPIEEAGLMARLTAGINQHLPEQIRIFGIRRVVNSFHAKERTDSRIYEYLVPTYVFHPATNREIFTKNADQEAVEVESEDENDTSEETIRRDPNVFEISEEEKKELLQYRIDDETLNRVTEVFRKYVGNHRFHNFTIGVAPTEDKARRIILDVWLEKPFLKDGMEWVRVKFHGQSFMLHQIRKMVGMVIMAVRLGAPPAIVDAAFGPAKLNIPKAPALGLLLDKAIFTLYNQYNPQHPPIDFAEYEDEREKLKYSHIYPGIFSEEAQYSRFWGWLKCNDDHASEFIYFTKPY